MENSDTTFALVTDINYLHKAKQTISDLRIKGKWLGDICLLTIDFNLDDNFKDYYNVIEVKKQPIDKQKLIDLYPVGGFSGTGEGREMTLPNQWEKLQIFDDYFRKWKRVIFVDAGMRIVDSVKYLLELDYEGHILLHYEEKTKFHNTLSKKNEQLLSKVKQDFGEKIDTESTYLNGSWIYDTNILDICNKSELIDAMYEYPLCHTNEMALMQLVLHHRHGLMKEYPIKASNGKYLFGYSDIDYPGTTWRDFCMIKYPVSIQFS